jgi:hypothetical protein
MFDGLKYISVIGIGIIVMSETGNIIVGLLFMIGGIVMILNNDIMRKNVFNFYRNFKVKMKNEVKNG